jgi:hypothetical protein
MLDPIRLNAVIDQVIGDQPHPKAPSLKVKDYKAHETVAEMMKNPDRPTPQDVVDAYHTLNGIGMSPAQFQHAWKIARPLANRFLGRDPDPSELAQFVDGHPADVYDYYAHSPYPGHEEIKAGDFVKYFHAATPIAQATIGRKPLPVEIARFAAAGYQSEDMLNHYTHEGKAKK